jgi:signal transduction histidine kinase
VPSGRLPLRGRLTLWYLLTLALLLLLYAVVLYWQTRRSLLAQVDAALRQAATQAATTVVRQEGRLVLSPGGSRTQAAGPAADDFAVYLLSPAGEPWSWLGRGDEFVAVAPRPGWLTLAQGGDRWRVYTEPVAHPGGDSGWLQVAQELEPIESSLASLRAQALLALPLALLLAGLGGYFLAGRALRPIDEISRTVQVINAGDMERRVDYQGPADEVGQLALTINHMLNRLQAAFERERRFTADAAHELRTPLTALKGRLEVTLSQPRPAAEYRQTLVEMGGQIERLIRLSYDLLLMARLESQAPAFRPERIELAELLAAVTEQVAPLAQARQITLLCQAPPGLAVAGNLELLIRLLLNLLDNGLKHAPLGGRVVIAAAAQANGVRLTVEDNGPGIPVERQRRLFERFYRLEDDRSRPADGGGAGLGLAIAQEIARAHGGDIQVESQPGQGALFIVRLPAAGG